MTWPRDIIKDAAIIPGCKVQGIIGKELSDTVSEALRQIVEKGYQASLVVKGISEGHSC